jgi:hypothetical protein
MTIRFGGAASALAACLVLLSAGPGQAHHVAGATYSGAWDRGRVEFDVSRAGTLTRFKVYAEERGRLHSCYEGFGVGIPISDHVFDGPVGPWESVSGSFAGSRSATGTFTENPPADGPRLACLRSGSFAWTATVDETAPIVRLGGSATQPANRGSVAVTVECPRESCGVTVYGTLHGAGADAARRFRLETTGDHVSSGFKMTLRLPIAPGTQRAIKRALREGRTVTAEVTVIARDAAGNDASKKKTIRLEL